MNRQIRQGSLLAGFLLVVLSLAVACSDPDSDPVETPDAGGEVEMDANENGDLDTSEQEDAGESSDAEGDADGDGIQWPDANSGEADADAGPPYPEPHDCRVVGNWSWDVKSVQINEEDGCSFSDCGYGSHGDCSQTILAVASSEGPGLIGWNPNFPGVLGEYEGQIDEEDGTFETVNQSFPESTLDGTIGMDCRLTALMEWRQIPQGGTEVLCSADIEFEGSRF